MLELETQSVELNKLVKTIKRCSVCEGIGHDKRICLTIPRESNNDHSNRYHLLEKARNLSERIDGYITPIQKKWIDDVIETGFFQNKSSYIRHCIMEVLENYYPEQKPLLEIVYDQDSSTKLIYNSKPNCKKRNEMSMRLSILISPIINEWINNLIKTKTFPNKSDLLRHIIMDYLQNKYLELKPNTNQDGI